MQEDPTVAWLYADPIGGVYSTARPLAGGEGYLLSPPNILHLSQPFRSLTSALWASLYTVLPFM